ncbi:hypothetical protein [Embleya sp. NPDC020630]|uniref:hypothetical protein n=1 Tax=Embleya sp. NPDC020630 TaxID=3363979 RepID=UPI0037ADD1D2
MEFRVFEDPAGPGGEFGLVDLTELPCAPGWRFQIGLRGLESGLVRPARVKVVADGGVTLNEKQLRRLPLARVLTFAVIARLFGRDTAVSVGIPPTRPKNGSVEFATAVAMVYAAAVRSKLRPGPVIQSVWGCSKRTAALWVREARTRGLPVHRAGRATPTSLPFPNAAPTQPADEPPVPERGPASFQISEGKVTSFEDFAGWREWRVEIALDPSATGTHPRAIMLLPSQHDPAGRTAVLDGSVIDAFPFHQFLKLGVDHGFDRQISMSVLAALGGLPRTASMNQHLTAVAAVYRTALQLGLPPRKTVAEYWGRTPSGSSVARWIREARASGLLRDSDKETFGNKHAELHHRNRCPSQQRMLYLRREIDGLVPRGDVAAGTREWRPSRAAGKNTRRTAAWPVIARSLLTMRLTGGEEFRQAAASMGKPVIDQFIVEQPEMNCAIAHRLTYNVDGTMNRQMARIDWPQSPVSR